MSYLISKQLQVKINFNKMAFIVDPNSKRRKKKFKHRSSKTKYAWKQKTSKSINKLNDKYFQRKFLQQI